MSKRHDYEGSTPREVRPGVWKSTVMLGYRQDGTRNRKTVTGATAAEARAKIRTLVTAHTQGATPTKGRGWKFQDWLDHYLDTIAVNRVGRTTLQGYRSKIRTHVTGHDLGRTHLARLTPEKFEATYARMIHERGNSTSTVRQLHRILSRALKIAVNRGLIPANPADRVEVPQGADEARFDPKVLHPDEVKHLMGVVRRWPRRARWTVGLTYGPRQAEALGLAWDMVDLDSRVIRFERTLDRLDWKHGCGEASDGGPVCGRRRGGNCPERVGGGAFLGRPKSAAGVRSVPMTADVHNALVELRAVQDAWNAEDGTDGRWRAENGVEVELVFRGRDGSPVWASADWDDFQALLAEAGLDRRRIHDGRHTAATLLLLEGVDSRVVMDIMGWSQISMLTRYQHVLDSMRQDAIDKVSEAFTPATPATMMQPENVVSLDAFRRRSG